MIPSADFTPNAARREQAENFPIRRGVSRLLDISVNNARDGGFRRRRPGSIATNIAQGHGVTGEIIAMNGKLRPLRISDPIAVNTRPCLTAPFNSYLNGTSVNFCAFT